jgi:glycosyltransferase involved in cell wall biosynthesis
MKQERPIRVLHVIDTLGMGGAETWLMEVLRFWSKRGVGRIDFLATSGNPGIFDEEARRLGAQVHYVRYGRAHLPRFAKQFRQILRDGQYDAIHDHQDYASGWHFLMGASELPPVRVTHVHNPWLHIEANYAVSFSRQLTTIIGKRLVRRLATHVCGTSDEILRRYAFQPAQTCRPKVSVVHCGFDVGKFNRSRQSDRQSVLKEFRWPEEAQIVLFAGRLDRAMEFEHPQNHKNSWFALNVVRAAADRQPSVRFLMAGAGESSRQDLESRVESWGLRDNLRLIGVRKDIDRLMRAADVLFFPSRQEGLGMVAVEAQAAGLPVLASTAVPRECVVIPELYHALPLGESIDLWAATLLQVMTKPRPPLELCRLALESSAFSIANSARRLEEIYSTTRQ